MNSYNTDIFFSDFYNLQSVHFEWKINDLDIFKVHIMVEKVNMACNFRVLVKTQKGNGKFWPEL